VAEDLNLELLRAVARRDQDAVIALLEVGVSADGWPKDTAQRREASFTTS